MQVRRELEWLYRETGARIGSCVGGMDMRTERRALADGAHIVVGTPGRLRDHITRGSLDISELRAVVLDEADEMLDLGFRDDLEFILAAAPDERRTLMFSATVPNQIAQLAKRFQRDALRITATGESSQHSDIEYQQILVAPADRENAIINTLLFFDSQNTIVFCHTREAVKHLASRLGNRGFPVVALSGELSQAERTNALQSMRDGRARVCVATDVAARGIDLPNLDLVIHADMPTNPDTLLHRSGRTGRAGRKGICTLIVPYHRRNAAARVLKLAKLDGADRARADRERHRKAQQGAHSRGSGPGGDAGRGRDRVRQGTDGRSQRRADRRRLSAPATGGAPCPGRASRRARASPSAGSASRARTPAPRDRSDFTNGVWFRVSVGRKHRAEPRWLLPMICKAGHVTKRAVGSIKILDTESQFEIAGDKAETFWAAVKENGTGEKGVTIQRLDGKAPARTEPSDEAAPPSWNSAKKGKFKPKGKHGRRLRPARRRRRKAKKKRPKPQAS